LDEQYIVFAPIIKRIYVRTVRYYTDGVAELICEGIRLYINYSQIPENGTNSIEGINTIISTSKQEIARFWKRKLFRGFPFSHFAYNNYDFITRQNKYEQCLAMLKKLL
jgi:hypothetical protein